MADRLGAIRKLLTHESSDRRCAAAIVLAELKADDKRSISALTEALDDSDPRVQRYALEALAQAQASDSAQKIVDLIGHSDGAVQMAAEAAVLQMGDAALPALQRLMEGPAKLRRTAAAVLSRLQSSAGIETLVDAINGGDSAVVDRARQALRARVGELDETQRGNLRKRIIQRLNDARVHHDHALAAALLQLLGDLPDETVVTRIVQEIGPDTPPTVRRAALNALMTAVPLARGRRREAALGKLLVCLEERNEDGVIRPALRALKGLELSDRFTGQLEKLLEAPSAEVRAYALGQLGRHGSPDSVETLVDQLVQGSAPVRAAAREALAEMPAAAPALARKLLEIHDARRQQDLGELLKSHQAHLPEQEAQQLVSTVLDRLEGGEPRLASLVNTLAFALPDLFLNDVRQRVLRRRKGKKIAEAYDLLHAIKDCPAFGEEEQYQLAVLGLLRTREPTGRPPKVTDRVCAPFAELLRRGFPLEARLRKERLLKPEDLFYVGFAFSESHDEDERDFGQELLEEVVLREPEGKFGARAQNKLKLTSR